MNCWEKKIAGAFISRYMVSAPRDEAAGTFRNSMRLRSVSIFPDFDRAVPDEKESYLEAAETLERKGLVSLNWEKRGKGERLKTINCVNMEKLFEDAGMTEPRRKAELIRSLFKNKLTDLEKGPAAEDPSGKNAVAFLKYLAEQFSSREVKWDMDLKAAEDFASLLDVFLSPGKSRNMTTRALSVSLYNDSKRMENILDLFGPALSQAGKQGVPLPDFSFLERSFPETLISGKIRVEYVNGDLPPLVNAAGLILGLPAESLREIRSVRTISGGEAPSVLTVENKETFYALGDPQNYRSGGEARYDCFLYTGGYPNKAAAALIRILAASGFRFFHAGDLDPDGILILQNIMDIAGRPVSPFRMDAPTFDRYLPLARALNKVMLRHILKIRKDTRDIPELSALIRRIEETRRGVEQEIIDYR